MMQMMLTMIIGLPAINGAHSDFSDRLSVIMCTKRARWIVKELERAKIL